ncbi:PAS domain S-box protein [Mycoplasmatota bacterium]|nr:PAS domain S-box protein [Mycoplasmatota bacterium]
MKHKRQIFLMLLITSLFVTLLVLFNVNHGFHAIVMQFMLVQVIFGIIFYPQFVLLSTILINGFHIVYDSIIFESIYFNAVIQGIIQIGVLFLVLNVFKSRKILKNRLANIIEASRVATWEWDIPSNKIIVNDRWAKTTGYTKEELSPMTLDTWANMVHPDDLIKAQEQLDKVIADQLPNYDIEIRIKHKNGQLIWVHDRGKVTKRDALGNALVMSGTYTDIDDKKRAKDKIKYYHQLMSYVIDHMNNGIAVHDKDLNYVYVSKKYLDQYHIEEDIIGKNHYEVFPDLPEKWKEVHQRCLEGEVIKKDRDPYVHEDGHIDVTRWECRPWYNEDNEIAGIIIYTEVINAFLEIEKALQESKETLQMVMDNLPIGIALHTLKPNFEFEYMNDMFPISYNTSKETLENNDFWQTVFEDEDFREKYKAEVFKAVESKDASVKKWVDVALYKNGEIVKYVTAFIKPIHHRNQYISTVIDTSTRKQLEESLLEKANEMFIQKEKTQATLLAIGDGVISTDHLGNIITFNDIATLITGYQKEEVVGKKFSDMIDLVDPNTNQSVECPITRVIQSKKIIYLEGNTVLITKNKERKYIEDSVAPIKDQNGELTGVILVMRDVTEDKEKQREIEYLSIHDPLTSLYNRRYFTDKLAFLDHEKYYPLGIMMIDVNGLKIINDAYGHDIGDMVLIEVANVLNKININKGLVSRIGGDEFTLIFSQTSEKELFKIKEIILEEIRKVTVKNVTLSVSIGYAMKYSESTDITEVLKEAENVMYRFKLIDGDSARNQTIKAIHKTLTDKYELERKHSERVGEISRLIGQSLKMERDVLRELEMSGLFHDIGKISIPDSILYKPERLTDEEYEIIKQHTRNGYMILRAAGEYSDLAKNALYHHEHFNGKGYPEGLSGENIPLQARIICVADAYEAMTSNRPYRQAMSKEKAIEELIKYKGSQFDPKIVDVFVNDVLKNHQV